MHKHILAEPLPPCTDLNPASPGSASWCRRAVLSYPVKKRSDKPSVREAEIIVRTPRLVWVAIGPLFYPMISLVFSFSLFIYSLGFI